MDIKLFACLLVLLWALSQPTQALGRPQVAIKGTTVGPSYHRAGGKCKLATIALNTHAKNSSSTVSLRCPPAFAYAMYDGYACCKYYYKKSNNDEDHVFEDAVDECPLGAYQNCSATDRSAKCQTDPANSGPTNE